MSCNVRCAVKCGDAMWNGVVHGGVLRCKCGSGIPSDVEWFDARHGGVMKCSQCGMCGTRECVLWDSG